MDDTTFPDERLELIFTCCHPALATDAQVALTLRTLGGLTTDEIARAFLVPEADDGPAAGAGQAQDQGGRHPVPGPARPSAARPAGRGAGGRLPDLQRGLRRPRRAGRRGDPARAGAGRADARRARGARPAGADAAARLPPRRRASGTASWCCSPTRTARCGTRSRSPPAGRRSTARSRCAGTGPLRRAGRDRLAARRGAARLAADRRALRRARAPDRLAGGRAQPRRRRRRGRGAARRACEIVDALPLEDYRYLHSTRAELLRRLGRTDEAREAYAKAIADFSDTPERRLLEQRMADLPT